MGVEFGEKHQLHKNGVLNANTNYQNGPGALHTNSCQANQFVHRETQLPATSWYVETQQNSHIMLWLVSMTTHYRAWMMSLWHHWTQYINGCFTSSWGESLHTCLTLAWLLYSVAVPGRNRTLFHCAYRSYYCVRSGLA